jgi:hypothetical protein
VADEQVRVVFKADTSGLQSGISGVKSKLGGLNAAFGQLTSGNLTGFASSMYGLVGPAGIAAGAVAAIGAAAYSAGKEFYELAINVGKFSDAIGVSTEEGSALYELAGDLGISIGSLEMAAKKLAGEGLPLTQEQLAKLATEYQNLEDPAERVAFLTENFGRSGMELAPLLEMNTELIRKFYEELGAGQTITEEEYGNAKVLRENLDTLGDSWTDLKLQVGGMVALPVTDFLQKVVTGLQSWAWMFDVLPAAVAALQTRILLLKTNALAVLHSYIKTTFGPIIEGLRISIGRVRDIIQDVADKIAFWKKKIQELKEAMPDWLIPGSPTPFELGLRGISSALRDVNSDMPGGMVATGSPAQASPQGTAELSAIRDDIKWMVRNLPTAISDAVAMSR